MKLTDLEPRWYGSEGITYGMSFLCPHCQQQRLGVAFHHAGHEAMEDSVIRAHSLTTQHIWSITGDIITFDGLDHHGFDHVTLSPSVDASQTGHWHGFIIDGEIK
jgi:hypothetical protein